MYNQGMVLQWQNSFHKVGVVHASLTVKPQLFTLRNKLNVMLIDKNLQDEGWGSEVGNLLKEQFSILQK